MTSFRVLVLATCATLSVSTASVARDAHVDPHWTYDEQGKWNLLMDRLYSPPYPYAECGIGQKQSPIDIDPQEVETTTDLDDLRIEYGRVPLSVTNNGHTIRVNTSQGHLFIGKNKYELVQLHFHAPGEHAVAGKIHPLEAHFVNGTPDGRLAVIGVFFDEGTFNPEFQKILGDAPTRNGATAANEEVLDLLGLLPRNTQSFYTYSGSLTTPPCSEGVQWFLFKEPVVVAAAQIEAFKNRFYKDNARREQKLNGRKIDAHE